VNSTPSSPASMAARADGGVGDGPAHFPSSLVQRRAGGRNVLAFLVAVKHLCPRRVGEGATAWRGCGVLSGVRHASRVS